MADSSTSVITPTTSNKADRAIPTIHPLNSSVPGQIAMAPKSKAKRHGSLTSFDSFRVSKPLPKSNLKNIKQQITQETPVLAPLERTVSIPASDHSESSQAPEQEDPVVRPQLNEHDARYTRAAEVILDSKQTSILHTNPNTIEIILRDFDLTGKYGPCVGLSRLDRFNRAVKMGMNPPPEVGEILATQQAEERSEYRNDLFYGRL